MISSTAMILGFFGLALVFISVGIAILMRSRTVVKVISTQVVDGKTYFAVRIEGSDFLFFKNKHAVEFLNALDEVDDFKEIDLSEFRKANEKKSEDTLKIPKFEKAS